MPASTALRIISSRSFLNSSENKWACVSVNEEFFTVEFGVLKVINLKWQVAKKMKANAVFKLEIYNLYYIHHPSYEFKKTVFTQINSRHRRGRDDSFALFQNTRRRF